MDPILYKNEIDRLSKEISSIKEPEKPSYNFMKYKYNVLIVVLTGVFFYIVKPKCILTIKQDKFDSEIVVNYRQFFKWWIVCSLIFNLVYYIFQMYKKQNAN